jgi:hypothetical protein
VAQRRVVQVVDDLTGGEGARTHRLRWDDQDVEIDLPGRTRLLGESVGGGNAGHPELGRQHGRQVSDRGQIPRAVLDAYRAAR